MAEEQVGGDVVHDTHQTNCCIVGGGPAGMVLAHLLARKNIPVTLLEAHKDFDRDFRGDTVHPSTLEMMDQLGLADRLLQIPHGKVRSLSICTSEGSTQLVDFGRLKTRFPYIMMLPQARFLDFLAEETKKLPSFRLVLGANVQRLVQANGVVQGVRYRGSDDAWHEVGAPLTVAADGRFSKIRSLVGLHPKGVTPPMDVVWLRLPRQPGDGEDQGFFYVHGGRFAVALSRDRDWQIGYVILKGGFGQLRAQGIEALRKGLVDCIPWLVDRVGTIHDWNQVTVLSVESSRLELWHKPGLLLIGDAAHVMSPVGGVGINYAIQDAVVAANLLTESLRKGQVTDAELAEVQRQREGAIKTIQKFQGFMQNHLAAPALNPNAPFRLPLLLRVMSKLPWLRDLPARLVAFGVRRVRIEG
jgi:2-polyprenyl-6-methoxyphenol hydroxylase-like FAD-dependent oxidoreductase